MRFEQLKAEAQKNWSEYYQVREFCKQNKLEILFVRDAFGTDGEFCALISLEDGIALLPFRDFGDCNDLLDDEIRLLQKDTDSKYLEEEISDLSNQLERTKSFLDKVNS